MVTPIEGELCPAATLTLVGERAMEKSATDRELLTAVC